MGGRALYIISSSAEFKLFFNYKLTGLDSEPQMFLDSL